MKKTLFLNLTAFSQIGGIERFNKCFLKALSELDKEGITDSHSYSAYDGEVNEKYYETSRYRGWKGSRLSFVLQSVLLARKYDVIILGHINLAIVGNIIKLLNPSKKLVLITHGIDVWGALSSNKLKLLQNVNHILAVSNFTKGKIEQVHGIDGKKITVFPNTIDPYFQLPDDVKRQDSIRKRYDYKDTDFVMYALTRLSHTEVYKGYDKVLEALGNIIKTRTDVKYLIGGKYDEGEKNRLDTLIEKYGLQNNVKLGGFLDEKDLIPHYQMADLYIMPSKKEGFGIVYIEALVCGLPVIAGNADGSVDALLNGKTGKLINPDSVEEIEKAILQAVEENNRVDEQKMLQVKNETLSNFSFNSYKQRLKQFIAAC